MRLPDVPRILRKIAVAVAVGSLTYVVTDLTEQPGIWSLTMTVLFGSIAFVVQFLVDGEGPLRLRTTLELRPDRVAEQVQWFEQIWQRAQPPPVYPS